MKIITEAEGLNGKRVLVRIDWNGGNKFRIDASMPTINWLIEQGAKVILATHLESGSTEVFKQFVPAGAELLPNLRENPGEEANSEEFAKELASRADIYVNEAFSVSHRNHASIALVPKLLPSYAGLRFAEEMKQLSRAFDPPHPFLLLLGGAKIETKLPLVNKFSDIADIIFIGGAMAVRASEMGLNKNPKILLPSGDLAALDSNDETMEFLKHKISTVKFIVWNGPLGKYEEGYIKYTNELAEVLAKSRKEVIIGGGDTLSAIESLNILDKFSFVSTAGGAMLDFLATGTLPGIEALG